MLHKLRIRGSIEKLVLQVLRGDSQDGHVQGLSLRFIMFQFEPGGGGICRALKGMEETRNTSIYHTCVIKTCKIPFTAGAYDALTIKCYFSDGRYGPRAFHTLLVRRP